MARPGPGLDMAKVRLTLWSPCATMAARCTNAGREVAPVSLPPGVGKTRLGAAGGGTNCSEVGDHESNNFGLRLQFHEFTGRGGPPHTFSLWRPVLKAGRHLQEGTKAHVKSSRPGRQALMARA